MKISTPHKLLQVIALACIFIFLNAKNVVRISEPLDGRLVENISSNWQYLEHNLEEIAELKKQENWIPISIPHTWNRWDAVDMTPGYRRDASWYQKEMYIKDYGNAQYVLYFEGSNISTDVYVNEQYAGSHIGGYVGFEIDITEQVKKGLKNTISIRVDNSYNRDIIPSQKSDFFIYGGITRDVWLKILPPVNIKKVRISTPEVSVQKASTTLKLDIHRADLLNEDFLIKAKIREKQSGKIVASTTTNGTDIKENNTIRLPEINRPKLWSPKNPQLYELATELWKGNTKIDEKTERLGYRWYEFEANGGFFLNGERLLLRGTHRHEEHAGYGAAMTNAMHRKDIEQMKDLGVNFLRLGHYPQDPEVYKTCDELGIIVWDELPWCRGGMGGETWKENTENLLTEQIIQNYNHPSIFFWSLGNEIYWLPDFENGDDEACLNAFVKQLNDLAHELDPYRLTSIRKYYAGADLVDVFSPSIWSGWYAGVYTNYKNTILKNQQKYPRFLHMEYGGSSHVGRHTENPITGDGTLNEDDWAEVSNQVGIKNIAKTGDWTENYIVDLFDWYLGVSETLDNFSGNAQWAFKDFGTPLRPENAIPYINQKGLVDRAGKPKDAYYVFKSYWAEVPFTYIESHTWKERRGPKGKARNLSVFSNCTQVELFQDGQSLGVKDRTVGKFPACGLNWDIQFKAGENQLIAHGLKDGKRITADTLTINYSYAKASQADRIQLSSRMLANGHHLIEAHMLDKSGERVLDYEQAIYFSKDGQGELLMNYGTPTRSQVIQMANGYAAIELQAAESGKAIVEARNQDFKGSYLVIDFAKANKKTQALLLTQPFDFDTSDKNKITGDYVSHKQLEVPQNLQPQNKWFMFEGPVLENDKIAYRYYADSRHRFDIYAKLVPDLVMDTVGWEYHDIMDWGSDVLKVGNSLGIGSPAICDGDTLYTLSNCDKKTIEILKNKNKIATIRTTFEGLKIKDQQFDLIQDWSIKAGEAWSEVHLKVVDGELPEGMYFATGIVKHLPDIVNGATKDYFYAMNWGKQSFHKENMGMAIAAKKTYQPTFLADELSHAYLFKNAKSEVRYRFLAAWERDMNRVKDAGGFKQLVEQAGK